MSAPVYAPASTPELSPDAPVGEPAVEPRCPNCGTVATRNFCPECGQECISVRLSLRDLAHEFLDDHIGWSTKVPRTLGRLLFRPGALTRDFIEGRRVRYLSPLRLYLSLSVIFFLVVASPPSWSKSRTGTTTKSVGGQGSISVGTESRRSIISTDDDGEESADARAKRLARADSMAAQFARKPPDTTTWRGRVKAAALRRTVDMVRMTGKQRNELFTTGIAQRMANVMFVLIPLFALFLKLLYWRRHRFYAEHFVFALHTHAVAYALLTLSILSPWLKLPLWLMLGCAVYFVLALRRVYGGGVFKTLFKSATLGVVYGTTLMLAATGVGAFIFFFG